MEKVFFKVDGEFLTNLARNLVLEGECEKATNILKKGICNIGYDIVVSILNGDKKFIGINDLDLISDDSSLEYVQKLKRKFSGTLSKAGKFWKPYAFVSFNCYKDIDKKYTSVNKYNNYSGPIPLKENTAFKAWAMSRNTFYMDDRKNDMAIECAYNGTKKCILWAEYEENIPFWIEKETEPQVALDKFLCYNEIVERKADENDIGGDFIPAYFDRIIKDDSEKLILGSHDLKASNGWLSPEGKLIPCGWMQHCMYATEILESRYKINEESLYSAGDELLKRKWIQLKNCEWFFDINRGKIMTQSQADTIFDYSKENNTVMLDEIIIE
jgi:hypothetical protein